MKRYILTRYKSFSWAIVALGVIILMCHKPESDVSLLHAFVFAVLLWIADLTAHRFRAGECSAVLAIVISARFVLGLEWTLWIITIAELAFRVVRYLLGDEHSLSYIQQKVFQYPVLIVTANSAVFLLEKHLQLNAVSLRFLTSAVFAAVFFVVNHVIANVYEYIRYGEQWTLSNLINGIKWDGYMQLICFAFGISMIMAHERIGIMGSFVLCLPLLLLTERLQIYNKMLETYRYLRQIYGSASQLAASMDIEKTVDSILDACSGIVDYDIGGIYSYDPDGQVLKLVSFTGEMTCKHLYEKLLVPEGLLAKKKWCIDGNVQKNADCFIPASESGVESAIILPLFLEERFIGAILMASNDNDHFTQEHAKALAIVGSFALSALDSSQRYRRKRAEAQTDILTGIGNYAYFVGIYQLEINRARQLDARLSIIILDIDHFKRVNDTYGHQAGNAILKQIAEIAQEQVRDSDIVCRYGGEEFVIILPGCNEEAGLAIAERIRLNVEMGEFVAPNIEGYIKVTVSMGLAVFPEDDKDPWELLDKADQALYDGAKRKGRNRLGAYGRLD